MEKNDTLTKMMLGIAIVLLIILIIGIYWLVFQSHPDDNGNIIVQLG